MSNENNLPNAYHYFDLAIKGILMIVAIITLISGINAFQRQYKAKFWDKQFDVYSEILTQTGILSSVEQNSEEFRKAKIEFHKIYFGESNLVVTDQVGKKLIEFRRQLEKLIQSDGTGEKVAKQKLRKMSLELSILCRKSASESWNVDIGKEID